MRLLIIALLASAITINGWGQCNPYYTIKEGLTWEMTSYNAKDKMESRQVTKVIRFSEKANGWDAVMSIALYDKKDKLTYQKEDVELGCADGVISMNMERFLPQETLEAFKDMNMEFEIDNLEIPKDLSVGKSLDDGGITITGNLPMTIKTTITDRKVEAKEQVTTPAGTFECFKITHTMEMDMVMKKVTKGAEWIAEGVGVVKSETYSENGKLMSYSMLTKVK